jgi:hypothetical protein
MNPRYPAVAGRAFHRCEYCHAPEVLFNFPFEVEHIRPLGLGGVSSDENLALACRSCNVFKGDRVEAVDEVSGRTVPLFDPRLQAWPDHFEITDSGAISGLTDIGRVTVIQLNMNTESQVRARQAWLRLGLFTV